MIEIRERINEWCQSTYGAFVKKHYDETTAKEIIEVFEALKITDKIMDGFSCEDLPKNEEGRTGLKISYSEFFHRGFESSVFSPASYLVSIVTEAKQQGIDKSKYSGILARELRSFTSLLREPDLALQLSTLLKEKIPPFEISLNPKQDSGDHTDILIKSNDILLRLWLYQFSSRGLPHDVERLTEKRGKLPTGIHILCPLHTEVVMDYLEEKERLSRLEDRIVSKKLKLAQCGAKAIKTKSRLSDDIEKLLTEKKEKQKLVDSLKSNSEYELTEVHGWFLYSDANAKRIAELIIRTLNKQQSVDNYYDVYTMLTAAEKYIGSNSIFIKEM